jgi:uncharacterized damage-inducible protein DinB
MLSTHLLRQLDRELPRARRVLEQLPDGKGEWKPHQKSMNLEYLAHLVSVMPTWIALQVSRNDLDLAPKDGTSSLKYEKKSTSAEFLRALEDAAAEARQALQGVSDDELGKNWQLKVSGRVVLEDTRANMIQDTLSHWSHHRGQMTVYLRLLDRKVPGIFGPSADEKSF